MRKLFLLDANVVFLNHGSFGACPEEVLAAQHAWQREMESNPVEFLGRRSAELLTAARARLASYVGAEPSDLVFVANATTGVNTVARSLDLGPGDEILTTDHEYGACDAAWDRVAGRTGARVVRVGVPLPFERDQLADRVLAAATARTRVITLSHITSATALIFPVAEVCRRARELGILTLVDGAHAPGHIPLDLGALGADFYTGNCHKWLCAPKGAAFLWALPEHHERLHAPIVSWGYRGEVDTHAGFGAFTGESTLERRLQWQGTRDPSSFLAVPAAIDFLARHDWEERRSDCHTLALETRDRIDALTGLAPICGNDDAGCMVASQLPPGDPEKLRAALFDRFRIEAPITVHDGLRLVRVSFHLYNTPSDADALVTALSSLLAAGS